MSQQSNRLLPATRSEVSTCSSTHEANAGMSPRATARACCLGISWNAWAVMMMAIHNRMPSVHSIGMTFRISGSPPIRHSSAIATPLTIE